MLAVAATVFPLGSATIRKKITMSFRSSELAIQPKTKARLRMAVKFYPVTTTDERDFGGVTERKMSPDELGDQILNEVIKEKYPLVIEYERAIAKIESEMLARGKTA